MNLFSFEVQDIEGNSFDWSSVEGKKIMIVNTASQCGLTPQYKELEELFKKYKSKGFCILGFPSNDFGAQEPGTNAEIASFCAQNYDVTFPMMSKISVIGEEQHPLYFWLTKETNESVSWNFQKFLINASGEVIECIEPSISPLDPRIIAWIESN